MRHACTDAGAYGWAHRGTDVSTDGNADIWAHIDAYKRAHRCAHRHAYINTDGCTDCDAYLAAYADNMQ